MTGADAPWQRRLELPDGRTVEIRPVGGDDVDGLALLYGGLSVDDLHRRFFSVYHPPRRFFEQLASIAERGGVGIVAAVAGPPPRIVGEADYALLPNGDGELAVTVAADWRGWLGPLLLEALVEAAAAHGVPNLEAEILVENRPMLALVRNRGFATLDHADYSVIRVLLGTHSSTPTWPGPHDRPRLLIEIPGGRWRGEEAARRAGWSVVTCPGPRPGAIPHCPVVAGGRCPLADGADVVLCALDPAQPGGAAVCEGHAGAGNAAVIPLGRDTSPLNLQADDATIVAALDELRSS
jgi:RimJ/RimL family protein N-acetyltransferase